MVKLEKVYFPNELFEGKNKDDFYVYEVQDDSCNPRFFPGDVVLIERTTVIEPCTQYAVVIVFNYPQLVKLNYDEKTEEFVFSIRNKSDQNFYHEQRTKIPPVYGVVRYLVRNFENEV